MTSPFIPFSRSADAAPIEPVRGRRTHWTGPRTPYPFGRSPDPVPIQPVPGPRTHSAGPRTPYPIDALDTTPSTTCSSADRRTTPKATATTLRSCSPVVGLLQLMLNPCWRDRTARTSPPSAVQGGFLASAPVVRGVYRFTGVLLEPRARTPVRRGPTWWSRGRSVFAEALAARPLWRTPAA